MRPIFTNSTPAWTLRLSIGLAQGIALALLWTLHARGSDPSLSTALLLAGVLAPPAFLEACDRVELKLLLLWSGTLAFIIATLGLWLPVRGSLTATPVAMLALLVLLAHITVRTALHRRTLASGFDAWTDTAWTVVSRLLVWATITTLAVTIMGIPALLNPFAVAPTSWGLISLVLLALASAAGFAVAAGSLRRNRPVFLTCCAAVLALLILGQGPRSGAPQQLARPSPPNRAVSIAIGPPSAPAPVPAPRARPAQPAATAQAAPDGEIVLHSAREFPASLLGQDWSGTNIAPCLTTANRGCDVWFLERNGREEILLAYQDGARVRADLVRQTQDGWTKAASASGPCPGLLARMRTAHQDGLPSGWRGALAPGKQGVELPCPRS